MSLSPPTSPTTTAKSPSKKLLNHLGFGGHKKTKDDKGYFRGSMPILEHERTYTAEPKVSIGHLDPDLAIPTFQFQPATQPKAAKLRVGESNSPISSSPDTPQTGSLRSSSNSDVESADDMDELISLQDKYLHALKIIKVLKKERTSYAKACQDKTTQMEKERQVIEQLTKLIKENIGYQAVELIRHAKRKSQSDPKQIEQVLHQYQQVTLDILKNGAHNDLEDEIHSSIAFEELLKEKDHLEDDIIDISEQLKSTQFANAMFRQSISKLDDQLKESEAANERLKEEIKEMKQRQQELMNNKRPVPTPLQKSPSIVEKFMEELRQNIAMEVTEKEKWKRQYIEVMEELDQLKRDLDKEQRQSRLLKKENKLLEKELEEQEVIYDHCKEHHNKSIKLLEAQLEALEQQLYERVSSSEGRESFSPVTPPATGQTGSFQNRERPQLA